VRIGYVAAQIARHGGIAVCTPIAPFAATRARVRAMAEEHADFLLVHVATPLVECERRDRKGLYARARAGEIPDFTGISSPYEEPGDADLTLDTAVTTPDAAAADVVGLLRSGGWLPPAPLGTRGDLMQRG
jgi:sulfate adenylyltransferase